MEDLVEESKNYSLLLAFSLRLKLFVRAEHFSDASGKYLVKPIGDDLLWWEKFLP